MVRYLEFGSAIVAGARELLMLILDISGSMADDDWKPSRLDGAREASEKLIEVKEKQYPDDLVGIVSFSSSARVVCAPVVAGEEAWRLKSAMGTLRPEGSTNITAGLELAEGLLFNSVTSESNHAGVISRLSRAIFGAVRFEEKPSSTDGDGLQRRVILLSDGEHNTGGKKPEVAADEGLKKRGVVIDCIGIGSRSGVDEELLMRIASRDRDGNPRYRFIGDKQQLIRRFEHLANRLRRS